MFIDGVAESENSTDFASFSLGEITRVSLGATSDSFPENIVNATIDDFRRFPEAISEETLKKLFCTDGNK